MSKTAQTNSNPLLGIEPGDPRTSIRWTKDGTAKLIQDGIETENTIRKDTSTTSLILDEDNTTITIKEHHGITIVQKADIEILTQYNLDLDCVELSKNEVSEILQLIAKRLTDKNTDDHTLENVLIDHGIVARSEVYD